MIEPILEMKTVRVGGVTCELKVSSSCVENWLS